MDVGVIDKLKLNNSSMDKAISTDGLSILKPSISFQNLCDMEKNCNDFLQEVVDIRVNVTNALLNILFTMFL